MGKFGWEVPEGFTLNPITHIRAFAEGAVKWITDAFTWAADLVKDVIADPLGTIKGWMTDAIVWVGEKFGFSLTDLAEFDIIKFVTDWVTGLGTSIANMLPDVSAIGQMFKDKLYSILPDWAKKAVDGMEITQTTTPSRPVYDRSYVERLGNEDRAMSQQLQTNSIDLENARANFYREIRRLGGEIRPNANGGQPIINFNGPIDQSSNSSGTVVNSAPPLSSIDSGPTFNYMDRRWG